MGLFFWKRKKEEKKNPPKETLSGAVSVQEDAELTQATFSAFTKETWFRCFPESTERAWKQQGCEDAVHLAILRNLEYLNNNKICDIDQLETVRMIAMDESYFQWLEEQGREDGDGSRSDYMAQVDDETAAGLWDRNNMGWIYTPVCLVCTVMGIDLKESTTTKFCLTPEQQLTLRCSMESIFGRGNVWVSRQLVDPMDFIKDEEEFREEGRIWLKEGQGFCRSRYNEQHYDDPRINVLNLCIPIVVSWRYGFEINLRELFGDFANVRAFPDHVNLVEREELEQFNIVLHQVIQEPVVFVNPLLVRSSNLMDFLTRQNEMLKESVENLKARRESGEV